MPFITRGLVYLFVCGSVAFAGSASPRIRVRVQNDAAPEAQVRAAENEAEWLFRKVGIDTVWVACAPEAKQLPAGDPCAEGDDSLAFTVRIMPFAAESASRDALCRLRKSCCGVLSVRGRK